MGTVGGCDSAAGAGATALLAEYAIGADPRRQDVVRDRAVDALVDTVGVALAARHEPVVRIVAADQSDTAGGPGSTLWTTGGSAPPDAAAIINGTAAHALDFDDVCDAMWGHPSAVILPALCAWGEHLGCAGSDVLDAYSIGLDVCCALGGAIPLLERYEVGWHATCVLGLLGAVAGAARLAGLDVTQTRHALGLATSMVAGSRANFGTMAKPLQVGLTGGNAVRAVRLASRGLTANPAAIEAPFGFVDLYAQRLDPVALQDRLAGPPTLQVEGLNVKRHACCYYLHRVIDAALTVRRTDGFRPDAIAAVRVTLEPGGQLPLIDHEPSTGLEAKFSAPYGVAVALVHGAVDLAAFAPERLSDRDVREVLRTVRVTESNVPPVGDADWSVSYATVEVELDDGRRFHERVDRPIGHASRPLPRSNLEDKFRRCAGSGGLGHIADQALAALRSVAHLPIAAASRALSEAVSLAHEVPCEPDPRP